MFPRNLARGFVLLFVAALAGCGGKPAAKNAAAPVNLALQARTELLHVAKKVEAPADYEAIEGYIKNAEHEDPEKRWKWEDLDEYIVRGGSYNVQTKMAYEKWRTAKIAASAKR
jgi:hypothetical protein